MKLTNFDQATDFLNVTRNFLEKNEPANSLMLGICLRLQKHPQRIDLKPYFGVIESRNDVVLAAVMTPPRKLVVNGLEENCRPATEALVDNLLENEIEVPGVLGPVRLATEFSESWVRKTKSTFRKGQDQRVFELRDVFMPSLSPGYLRPASESELELLTDWTLAFEREVFSNESVKTNLKRARNLILDQALFFWDDKRPVSMAAKTRPTANGISIGFVYTPPEFRQMGYASSCVASLSRELLDTGYQYCSLFTDLANPTSNSIYRKMGYQPVCDYVDYFFDR